MNEPEEQPEDQRYDEAAISKMAALWAQMYAELTLRGIPPKYAFKLVQTWISNTLAKS